jgi:hypothetical protein
VTRLEIRGQKQVEFLNIIGDVYTGQNENTCGGGDVGKRCTALRKRGRKKNEWKRSTERTGE